MEPELYRAFIRRTAQTVETSFGTNMDPFRPERGNTTSALSRNTHVLPEYAMDRLRTISLMI